MNHTKEIRDFIITNFIFGDAAALAGKDDTSFLDTGIIDSTGMLELVMFLEQTYDIKIEPEEMLPENLDSVNQVAAFLSRKKAAAAGAA
jgi:acyl carrier protein